MDEKMCSRLAQLKVPSRFQCAPTPLPQGELRICEAGSSLMKWWAEGKNYDVYLCEIHCEQCREHARAKHWIW